jgi:hypothetical protein
MVPIIESTNRRPLSGEIGSRPLQEGHRSSVAMLKVGRFAIKPED